jgi:hypothetical protein
MKVRNDTTRSPLKDSNVMRLVSSLTMHDASAECHQQSPTSVNRSHNRENLDSTISSLQCSLNQRLKEIEQY